MEDTRDLHQFLLKSYVLKIPQSHQTFGLLLKDNLSPRAIKNNQSGHSD